MSRKVQARLHWLIKMPEKPLEISRPARFDHQDENWTQNAWSLVVTTEKSCEESYQTAVVRFLVPDAPHEWLSVGKRFTLFDGRSPLADGVVEKILTN